MRSPEAQTATFEQALVSAILTGTSWSCPPDKLTRLSELSSSAEQKKQVESWKRQWELGSTTVTPSWFQQDRPTFMVLQYTMIDEEQLRNLLTHLPRGTQLQWQFWKPGEISPPVSMATQDAVYERLRVVAAQHGVVLDRANHP